MTYVFAEAKNIMRHDRRTRERGAVAIVVALSLTLLIGCLALVLDLGRLYIAKAELQNAADAAALAAAHRLDGSAAGVTNAVDAAMTTASQNSFWGNLGEETVTLTRDDVSFSSAPDDVDAGSWESEAIATASPGSYFFVRVDTATRNFDTWFAGIWQIFQTSANGAAVAGRYPPGSLNPLFIPVVRRNSDQANTGDSSYPWCNGKIYDPTVYKKACPTVAADYRGPDSSGNWGYLKPGETRNGETGTYYQITPRDYNKLTAWEVPASWKGNIGFMLPNPGDNTQKAVLDALCRGGSTATYSAPGCGDVHTGHMSAPKQMESVNTRFDQQSTQRCPSDDNVKDFGAYYNFNGSAPYPPSGYPNGFYLDGYTKPHTSANYQAPINAPPGMTRRRIIRGYIVDNAWLPGYPDGSACTAQLTGGSHNAHLVGCAEFFLSTPAVSSGLLNVEYVARIPTGECSSVSNFADVRLYH